MKHMTIFAIFSLHCALHASDHIISSGSCPSSPVTSRYMRSQQPSIFSRPYNEFWYKHCLIPRCHRKNYNTCVIRLLLQDSSGSEEVVLQAEAIRIETSSKKDHTQPYYKLVFDEMNYNLPIILQPVLHARMLDALPANRPQQFIAHKDHTALFEKFGCIPMMCAISPEFIGTDDLLFSVDQIKKLELLKTSMKSLK